MKNDFSVNGDVVTMDVQGEKVMFDVADVERVGKYRWRKSGRRLVFTSYRDEDNIVRTVTLHKYITGSKHVRFVNGSTFDLRRSNLLPTDKVELHKPRGVNLKGNEYRIEGDTVIVLIKSKGVTYEAYIDYEDYPVVRNYTWCRNVATGYAQAIDRISRRGIYMHRLIMDASGFYDKTDHINGNRLDNRKHNLRICSDSQNHHNNIKHRNGTSGIYEHTKGKYWTACLMIKGKDIHRQKTFKNYEDAVAQRRAWEKEFNPSGLNGEN
jgi:hypothetical protein